MFRFCISCIKKRKRFWRCRKLTVSLFCVALLLIILNVKNFSFRHSSETTNWQKIPSKNTTMDENIFDGHFINSTVPYSVGKRESNIERYNSLESTIAISHDTLITSQMRPLQNDGKLVSDEKRISSNSVLSFEERLVNFLNTPTNVPPYDVDFLLNHPQLCPNKGSNVTLILTVSTAVDHEEARSAIRETWGGYGRERGAKLLFFVGISQRSELNERLRLENEKFHDIIQSNFLDTYNNLTLKTVSMLKWVLVFCPGVKYMLKVDDDVFLNLQGFLDLTSRTNSTKSIMGVIYHDAKPIRWKAYKWYIPHSVYPLEKYPDYIVGPAYLISGDAVQLLYEATIKIIYAAKEPFYLFEDVCVTGFAAEITGIKRISLKGMFNYRQNINSCNFQNILSSHRHSPQYIRERWIELKKSNFTCRMEITSNPKIQV